MKMVQLKKPTEEQVKKFETIYLCGWCEFSLVQELVKDRLISELKSPFRPYKKNRSKTITIFKIQMKEMVC